MSTKFILYFSDRVTVRYNFMGGSDRVSSRIQMEFSGTGRFAFRQNFLIYLFFAKIVLWLDRIFFFVSFGSGLAWASSGIFRFWLARAEKNYFVFLGSGNGSMDFFRVSG